MRAIVVKVHVDGIDVNSALRRALGDEDLDGLDHDDDVLEQAVVRCT